jgi:hypothetical protein
VGGTCCLYWLCACVRVRVCGTKTPKHAADRWYMLDARRRPIVLPTARASTPSRASSCTSHRGESAGSSPPGQSPGTGSGSQRSHRALNSSRRRISDKQLATFATSSADGNSDRFLATYRKASEPGLEGSQLIGGLFDGVAALLSPLALPPRRIRGNPRVQLRWQSTVLTERIPPRPFRRGARESLPLAQLPQSRSSRSNRCNR